MKSKQENIYVLDTNSVTINGLNSNLSIEIIEEISYELRGRIDIKKNIKDKLVSTVFGDTLECLHKFVPELVDQGVLNLNEGNGDAMLGAYLLSNRDIEQCSFLKENRVLVTNDGKLRDYAKSKGVNVIDSNEFSLIVDSLFDQQL